MERHGTADLIVVGGGAAGLATAIFCARQAPHARIRCLDGAARLGAKILVSGGSRCNVTNTVVNEHDFWGSSRNAIRIVLRAFPERAAVDFFEGLGVTLHEEEDGKLFPDSNRSRDVLDALLREAGRCGVELTTRARVVGIGRRDERLAIETADGDIAFSRFVAVATGGRSLPKSGSDGQGYELVSQLGHTCVQTTPALVPLILDGDAHARLAGVSHPAEAVVRIDGKVRERLSGALLWTHFGASGPLVLNVSRHWHRAVVEGRAVTVTLSSVPGESFDSMDRWLQEQQHLRPRASVASALSARVPASVSSALTAAAGLDDSTTMAHLGRERRRALVSILVERELRITDSRGYNFAEVTAGGVPLDEVDPRTLESKRCEGLYLAGEILNVDGRLGGFNFQWAWASGFVAGTAVARRLLSLA